MPLPQVLLALQIFLDEPEGLAAGRQDVHAIYKSDQAEYRRRVQQQVAKVDQIVGSS